MIQKLYPVHGTKLFRKEVLESLWRDHPLLVELILLLWALSYDSAKALKLLIEGLQSELGLNYMRAEIPQSFSQASFDTIVENFDNPDLLLADSLDSPGVHLYGAGRIYRRNLDADLDILLNH